jgi:hypothetical protein
MNTFTRLLLKLANFLLFGSVRFGVGMEVISGAVTAPGATFTPWTVVPGNSLTIRSAPVDSKIWLISAWGFNQVAGVLRVRSPRLHDNVQGIRMRVPAANSDTLYPDTGEDGFNQFLISQDNLTVEHTGSAVGGQIESGSLLVYYENLPAINGRYVTADVLDKSGINIMGQEISITTGATVAYTGQVTITQGGTIDNFKPNTDYALLGVMVDTRVATIRIQGVDIGNLGIGIPGEPTQRHIYQNWFQRLGRATGKACIPVFNSAGRSSILVDALGNQAAITTVATFFFVELQPGVVPLVKSGV